MKYVFLISTAVLLGISAFSQDFLDRKDYKRLYRHVQRTPDSLENDPDLLVNYLKQETNDRRELIEIIYYWISDNISYDIEGFMTNSNCVQDGYTVLETKKSVCQGYAELFQLLCVQEDIECEIISGYAKGYGFNGKRENEPNHSWNAVKLNGNWKLIDVTWGSGNVESINGTLTYRKNLNLGYIFSKPEGFVIEHFPEDNEWQLLDKPITLDEFYSDSLNSKIKYKHRYLR